MKATLKTMLGEVLLEGTVEEIRELLTPMDRRSSTQPKGQALPSLVGYKEAFRSKGLAKNGQKPPREYIYYRRDADRSYIVDIVGRQGGWSERLVFGSLNDPDGKLGDLRAALDRMPWQTTFTRREFFDQVEDRWWKANRRRQRAGAEILVHEGLMEKATKPPTVPTEYRKVREPLAPRATSSERAPLPVAP